MFVFSAKTARAGGELEVRGCFMGDGPPLRGIRLACVPVWGANEAHGGIDGMLSGGEDKGRLDIGLVLEKTELSMFETGSWNISSGAGRRVEVIAGNRQ